MATVSRTVQPQLPEYLQALSKSEGADPTLAGLYSSDPARNGEPFGEIALVDQHDAAWGDQHGAPRDPQAGNIPGAQRDVLRTSGTKPLDAAPPPGSAATLALTPVVSPAPSVAPSTPGAGRSTKKLTLIGPADATARYTITDGTRSVSGTAVIGGDGTATVDVDVSSLADGVLTGTFSETDILGNSAEAGTLTWLKDTVAATGLFVVNGATPIGGVVATTNRFLTLGLAYSDSGSGLAQMSVSTDNGATWSDPTSYSALEAAALADLDGLYTVVVKVTDAAGNATFASLLVRLDRAGPQLTDSIANGSSIDIGQVVTLTVGASDVDGVKTVSVSLDSKVISSGTTVRINIDTLAAGNHTIVVSATDQLGNSTTLTVTFRVSATVTGLINAVNDGVAAGKITSSTNAMMTKLQSAQAAVARGDKLSAMGLLLLFVNQVQTQAGKGIATDYANLLVGWANDLIARLG
jgi:hypothetical protein